MSYERRNGKRYALWVPIQMKGPDLNMLAVSKNISWSGALMIAGASLPVGERVELVLQLPGAEPRQIDAEIVRVEGNDDDPEGLWRYRIAVRFAEELRDMEPHLVRLEKKQP